MDYIEHIENVLKYIEANLKNELNLSDLAKTACYSEYHFLRIFKYAANLTPADYIRKRRLSEIVREVDKSGRPISEIAFEYGFNSKENFTRAFKTEHNILPTEYRQMSNSLKLFDRLQLTPAAFDVTPKIITLESFSLTGFVSGEDYIPKFWNLYNCKKLSLRLSGGKITADYGVNNWNSEKERLDYFIGILTDEAKGDTSGTVQLEIPGGLYAVFATPPASHFNFIDTVHKTWKYIHDVWMPQSDYKCASWNNYQFETYVEASRTYSEDIYIPIEEKESFQKKEKSQFLSTV